MSLSIQLLDFRTTLRYQLITNLHQPSKNSSVVGKRLYSKEKAQKHHIYQLTFCVTRPQTQSAAAISLRSVLLSTSATIRFNIDPLLCSALNYCYGYTTRLASRFPKACRSANIAMFLFPLLLFSNNRILDKSHVMSSVPTRASVPSLRYGSKY